jgi:hypothetical protein
MIKYPLFPNSKKRAFSQALLKLYTLFDNQLFNLIFLMLNGFEQQLKLIAELFLSVTLMDIKKVF